MNWAIKKAKHISQKYGSPSLSFLLGRLLTKLKLELYEMDLGSIKEVYFRDLKAIVINSKLHFYQKRRVIAHAIGHHLLHKHNRADYFKAQRDDPSNYQKLMIKEREAEMFASYLLIPEQKLNPLLEEDWLKESLNPVSHLAEEFQVPPDLVKKRLEFRELFEC